jgi:hypothetical protein
MDEVCAGPINRLIGSQEAMHHCCPQRRGCADCEGIAHPASIEVPSPHRDRVLLVKADSPSVAETAACAGLDRNTFIERKGRDEAEAFPARIVIAKKYL